MAFQQSVKSIGMLDCIGSGIGCFASNAFRTQSQHLLLDPSDQYDLNIEIPEKNYPFKVKDGLVAPCEINKDLFFEGFKEVISICKQQNQEFLDWLDRDCVRDIRVRVLPLSTQEYQQHLKDFNQVWLATDIEEKFRIEEEFKKIGNLQERKKVEWLDSLAESNSTFQISTEDDDGGKKIIEIPTPNFIVLNNMHLIQDLTQQSIPIFYHRINSQDLIDARGYMVKVNFSAEDFKEFKDYKAEKHAKLLAECGKILHYFSQTNSLFYARKTLESLNASNLADEVVLYLQDNISNKIFHSSSYSSGSEIEQVNIIDSEYKAEDDSIERHNESRKCVIL